MKKFFAFIAVILIIVLTAGVTVTVMKRQSAADTQPDKQDTDWSVTDKTGYDGADEEESGEYTDNKDNVYYGKEYSDLTFSAPYDTENEVLFRIYEIDTTRMGGTAGGSLRVKQCVNYYMELAVMDDKEWACIADYLDKADATELDFFSFKLTKTFQETLKVIDERDYGYLGQKFDAQSYWGSIMESPEGPWMDCTVVQAVRFMSHLTGLLEERGVQYDWEEDGCSIPVVDS